MTSVRGAERRSPRPAPLEPPEPNSLAKAMGLLGDEWTLLLLRMALLGATRYSQFAAQLPISHAVLAARLDVLVQESLMERVVYQTKPERSEYVLTEVGSATWPILVAIWGWERRWVAAHSFSTPPMRHRPCGHDMSPLYCCSACGRPAPAPAMRTTWGPSGTWRRSVPATTTRRRSEKRSAAPAPWHFYPDTMAILGNRWSAAIVGAAFRGVRRFSDFQELLLVPENVLAERLATLCARDILRQVQLEARPDWSEYRLSAKGLDFFPVIALGVEWSKRAYPSDEGPVLTWTHRDCGQPFSGVLRCDQCGERLVAQDIDVPSDG